MKNNDRIAITGVGVLSACGNDKVTFWDNLKSGKSFINTISKFDASRYSSRMAGEVIGLEDHKGISKRLINKIDRFSHMALLTTQQVLDDSNIDLDGANKERVGVFVGNAIGGWQFAEEELRNYYVEGRDGISPFMASAWFPAAPQGQISIYFGLKGYSKTLVSDRASSALALWYGARSIIRDKNDYVIAGGMEAPISPFALLCLSTNNELSKNNFQAESAYCPYDKKRDGYVLGEGSALMSLEKESSASARNSKIYGFITGCGFTSDGYHYQRPSMSCEAMEVAIKNCLKDAGWVVDEVDYICLDGKGCVIDDYLETEALKKVFGKKLENIVLSAPKSMYGNTLGAQTAFDLASTIYTLNNNIVFPTINYNDRDPYCDLDYTPNKYIKAEINKALILSRGRGGINVVLAIENK